MTSLLDRMSPMFSGVLAVFVPSIAAGTLIELLRSKGVTTKVAIGWVEENKSLWGQIGPEDREKLRHMVQKLGNADWITKEWAIGAVRKDLPALASLFLGWKKANNWLGRQITELKKELMV